jgi:UDP-N-acetyl-2-amino-2-deoxyglucuronate dehydrogenase
VTPKSRLRIGIIGCGDVARRYPPAIRTQPRLQLRAVTDLVPGAALRFGSDFGVEAVPALDRFLSLPLELICICTPNHTHAELSRICVDHDFDVVVEHPLSLSVAEGEELVATVARRGRHLFVVRQRRFLPSVQALKQILARGLIGEIREVAATVSWNRTTGYYAARPWRTRPENGGVVLNQASHFLDILLYLFGEPRSVRGLLGNLRHRIPVEDSFFGQLEFTSGLVAEFSCTTAAPPGASRSRLTVRGERSAAKLSGRAWERLEHTLDRPPVGAGRTSAPDGGDHAEYLDRVARRLAGEAVEVVNARDSMPALRVAERIYGSATEDHRRLHAHFSHLFEEMQA